VTSDLNITDLQLKYLELETLLDITNDLNSFEDIQVLIQEILVKSCGLLNANSGLILVEDSNSDILHIEANFNLDISILRGILFKKNRGVLKEIINSRKALSINIKNDLYFSKTLCKFGLIAPLFDKNSLAGAIVLFDKESRKGIESFSDSDSNMLSALAAQASIAYTNIKLIKNIKEAKTFNENVMQSIATGVFTTNLMGEINHINKTALNIINQEREQIIGNHYEYIFDSNQHINRLISKCEQDSITISESQVNLQCNEKITTVNISVSPLMSDFEMPIGTVVAMEDLSSINKLKSTFKKYVSTQIVDQLLENDELLNLGGQEQNATILFSDIRGFTSLSENMKPSEVVETLNDYFNQMIEIIFKYNGILDKIIGDELMVIYGVPNSNENDSENAVRTAIEMQEKLIEFNLERFLYQKKPIKVGIGINRGSVISGNIGSSHQMDFTVIGDSVNLASRLCSHAQPGEIIISDNVWKDLINQNFFISKKLKPIKVKGKEKPIIIKEILYDKWKFNYDFVFIKLEDYLLKNLSENYTYHSIDHFRDVVYQVERIAKKEKIKKDLINDIKLAAWLHDIGYIWSPYQHEKISANYAEILLKSLKYPESKIKMIKGMILATQLPQKPKNILEEIICDADLDYLGRSDYTEISDKLRMELELDTKITDLKWLRIQENFLKSHRYFTTTSQKQRTKNKHKQLKKIESKLKSM